MRPANEVAAPREPIGVQRGQHFISGPRSTIRTMSQQPTYVASPTYVQPPPSPVATFQPQYVALSPSATPVLIPQLRADPVVLDCPRCRATVQTSIAFKAGGATWLWAALGCFLCSCVGGAIPFCIDGCKDVEHSCPNCGYFVGKYSRL